MFPFNIHPTLLADIDRFQAMRGGLKPTAPVDYTSSLLLILFIVAVIGVVVLAVRYFQGRARRTANDPSGLFRELSRVHGLDRQQQRLLAELASGLALEHPSRLFLEPNLLEEIMRKEQFAKWQSGSELKQIEALRERLFGEELALELHAS